MAVSTWSMESTNFMREETMVTRRWMHRPIPTLQPSHAERHVFKYRHTDALSLSGALNIVDDEVLGTFR